MGVGLRRMKMFLREKKQKEGNVNTQPDVPVNVGKRKEKGKSNENQQKKSVTFADNINKNVRTAQKRKRIINEDQHETIDSESKVKKKKSFFEPELPTENTPLHFHHKVSQLQYELWKKGCNEINTEVLSDIGRLDDEFIEKYEKGKGVRFSSATKAEGLDYLLNLCDPKRMKIILNKSRSLWACNNSLEEGTSKDDVSQDKDLSTEYEDVEATSDEDVSNDEVNPNVAKDNSNEYKENTGTENKKEVKRKTKKKKGKSKKGLWEDIYGIIRDETGQEVTQDPSTENKDVEATRDKNVSKDKISPSVDKGNSNEDKVNPDEFKETTSTEKEKEVKRKSKKNKGKSKQGLWEDIYGKLRDETGQEVTQKACEKYRPPHFNEMEGINLDGSKTENEEVKALKFGIVGILNKLTEATISTSLNSMEELYSKNRFYFREVILDCYFKTFAVNDLKPRPVIITHSMLLCLITAKTGSEFGYFITEYFVLRLFKLYEQGSEADIKKLSNLILLVCHLYTFMLVESKFICDMLSFFLEKYKTYTCELIVVALSAVGFSLKKTQGPEITQIIFDVTNKEKNNLSSSRQAFLVETLQAIQKNNHKRVPGFDEILQTNSLLIFNSKVTREELINNLQIKLDVKDLLEVEEKGRWWIIGASYKGDHFKKNIQTTDTSKNNKFAHLMGKLRLNTPLQKWIFITLMSSTNYRSASEQFVKKEIQFYDAVEVAILCLISESKYNPYYAYVIQHTNFVSKYKVKVGKPFITILNGYDVPKPKIIHLVRFVAYLLISNKFNLSFLKVIDFVDISSNVAYFLKQLFIHLFTKLDEQTMMHVFKTFLLDGQSDSVLKETVKIFLHHFVLKGINEIEPKNAELIRKCVNKVEELINVDKSYFE